MHQRLGQRFLMSLAAGVTFSLLASVSVSATTVELVTNGGFETGDLSGWTVTDQAGGSGTWFPVTGTVSPLSGLPTVGPNEGDFYALTDQTGPGAHALTQTIVVDPGASSVIFSFDMFINDFSGIGPVVDPSGLDYTAGGTFATNQFGTVDLLAAGADGLSTTVGVLDNFYLGVTPGGSGPNPYVHFMFDITSLVASGGSFDLRFAEVDNSGFFNMGIDNVSVLATSAPIPEPATMSLIGMGLIGLAVRSRRNKKEA